jgi:hypothetical protein
VDRAQNSVLLSWIEGEKVGRVAVEDIDLALAFLGRLHELRHAPALPPSRLAAEACLSGAEIERQLGVRFRQLLALEGEAGLRTFLESDVAPSLENFATRARREFPAGPSSFDLELAPDRRTLAPSDFGFHNTLRGRDGGLTFIDFEYFGWDDPVKLTADVLLHPGAPLAAELKDRFRRGAERIYGSDAAFAPRLQALYPLFGLRWVLILLNEFHPERWRRRLLAGAAGDWGAAKARQLEAARDLLSRLER